MIKQHKLGYTGGMSQDFAKSKSNPETYVSAKNIRVVASDQRSSFALTNEKGNELEFSIPRVSIDHTNTRLEYTATTLTAEPQSTNLIEYSEDLGQTYWNAFGSEVSRTFDTTTVNPEGTLGAYKLEGVGGLRRFGVLLTLIPSTDYTFSFYVKNVNATVLKTLLTNSSPSSYTFTSEVNTTDWTRVEINFTTSTGTSTYIQMLRDYTVGGNAYFWGVQLEQRASATSYIPTNGAIATRLATEVTTTATPRYLPYTKLADPNNPGSFEFCELEDNYPNGLKSADQVIIGVCDTRNGAILVTTDDNRWDCFWEVSNVDRDSIELNLLYVNDLNLSKQNLVQVVYNYENSIIEKIYFTDGINQLRFMNIRQSIDNGDLLNLVDTKTSSINIVSEYSLSAPLIKQTAPGGEHTAGIIQYAYNLYVLNGSQTSISPLSESQSLDNGPLKGGGAVNENVSRTVTVNVENIDKDFTHIRLYAVKYTSKNTVPEIGLIADREIGNYNVFSYFDAGSIIEPLSLSEFLFLGSNPITPRHIESKDNRLFAFNFKERSFDVELDTRIYGHASDGQAKVWEDITFVDGNLTGSETALNTTTYELPEKHDSVNRDYSLFPYVGTGEVSGGTGEYSRIEFQGGPANADGDILIQPNGVLYQIPVLSGDTAEQAAVKCRDYLNANLTGYEPVTVESGLTVGNKVYLKITRTAVGNVTDTVTVDTLGFTLTELNIDGTDDAPNYGAEGKYFRLTINQKEFNEEESVLNRYLKDKEIYRFGIVFYNNVGQTSSPKWLCDIKAPTGNLEGKFNTVKFETKPAFATWLANTTFEKGQKPVGYKIVRAERTLSDKTILTQGMINGMVVNYRHDLKEGMNDYGYEQASSKMPSLTRQFGVANPATDSLNKNLVQPYRNGRELSNTKLPDLYPDNWAWGYMSETHTSCSGDDHVAQTWQFTKLMQMYTPELLFENIEIDSSYQLRVLGLQGVQESGAWNGEWNPATKQNTSEAKFTNGWASDGPTSYYDTATSSWVTIPYANPVIEEQIEGSPSDMGDIGMFGPTENSAATGFSQLYKRHKKFYPSTGLEIYNTFGTPEITERGAGFTPYNGVSALRYSNSLETLLMDNWENCDSASNPQQIRGVNSWGAKCITFAEGTNDASVDPSYRKSLEKIYELAAPSGGDGFGVLTGEFFKPDQFIYAGNIYGGNSYESKTVSNYIEVGGYADINTTEIQIDSPGDTFVQEFIFTKLSKTDTEVSDRTLSQCTEFCSFMVETTVDLKNRNDISIYPWDNRYHPKYDEYQEYNSVYSQEANLVQTTDPGFSFKKVKEFDGRIISTKLKTPGEKIDSWTDFLENETMDLDGKYGPINATLNFKDNIVVFQDTALALININPRVQIAPGDGQSIELGTGGILHDYRYLSTESGSLNKRGVIATPNAFYYLDLNTLSLMQSNGQGVIDVSDQKGFHSFMTNNLIYDSLIKDNAVIGEGPSFSYSPVNNEVYFTIKQVSSGIAKVRNDYTLCMNENLQQFTSFYDYTPAWYINKGNQMLTSDPTSKQFWSHFKGTNGSFYGVTYDSSISWNVVPVQGDGEFVFNNVMYKMEAKNSLGNDIRDSSFNKVELSNEYQKSGIRDLVLGKNLKRRNRTWSVVLPREQNSMNRIKSPWVLLTMSIDNTNNLSMVAHDLIVSYTEY